jgi:nucleoside-diphosphate-sugar epimerase
MNEIDHYSKNRIEINSLHDLCLCRNGVAGGNRQLHTVVLRPPVMYGEYDPWYVIAGLRTAHSRDDKTLHRVGDGTGRLQTAYVGNVAWAHLCAARL